MFLCRIREFINDRISFSLSLLYLFFVIMLDFVTYLWPFHPEWHNDWLISLILVPLLVTICGALFVIVSLIEYFTNLYSH
ncbi:MAG: hypothetical protein HW401_442 [Parcubacteria group bacterium]|nr:hypothetical protein [Parcubacteria group bacterium]